MGDLYETDTYSWAVQQAEALRRRSHNALDWDNLAEEIESLGKSEARELENRLAVLLAHLLKWMHQPERRGASWEITIRLQRELLARHLEQNPGLKPNRAGIAVAAYRVARLQAALETELPVETFPKECPFTLEDALAHGFWPDAPAQG